MTLSAPRAINPEFAEQLEKRRIALSASLDQSRKRELGQYFTPWQVAQLMSGMFKGWGDEMHLLEPCAGGGMLAAAWIDALLGRETPPRMVRVTAFEVDGSLVPSLKQTLSECARRCEERGIEMAWQVRNEDFIAAGVSTIQSDVFAKPIPPATAAIINPPYKKIGSDSETARLLRSVGLSATNLYSAFLGLTIRVLASGAEFVAITPRSFCNGPYFRSFRKLLLTSSRLERVHVFDQRNATFTDDAVLQENVILHATKGRKQGRVLLTQSTDPTGINMRSRRVSRHEVIPARDKELVIHVDFDTDRDDTSRRMLKTLCTLESLGLQVSTGRVVDFRAREHLRNEPDSACVPLIYPLHCSNGFVDWPRVGAKKPNGLVASSETSDLLVPNGNYVLVRRFSAKEEKRRIVATVFAPERLPPFEALAFENHLNYFHARGGPLSAGLARGLAAFLNTSFVDGLFREFSGNTQVNATDLRRLPYPPIGVLCAIGLELGDQQPAQLVLDAIVTQTITRLHVPQSVAG